MSNPMRIRSACLVLAVALSCSAAGACLYDAGHRCGPAMTFVEAADACVCDPDAVPVVGGCQRCAADEVAVSGKCGCPAGEMKNPQNVCTAVAGLGEACDTATKPCTDATYSVCAVKGSGTAGTCTNACASNNDCGAAYTCATWEAQPFCRTFDGAGDSCTSSASCTGDAMFCDTQQTHVCIVQGCSLTANDCPRGTTCQDYSNYSLGTLCTGGAQ